MIIKPFRLFRESLEDIKSTYKPKNIITELCVGMILLNNEFLDDLLDRGIKNRYTNSSSTFVMDLKGLLLHKKRLRLGKFENGKCVPDDEDAKINTAFMDVNFDIESDWNTLINARITARNIIDKILVDDKLSPEYIKFVFWLGPNQNKDYPEDIVLELNDGRQFSFYLNKNLTMSKSASFNKFADDLIGESTDKLYGPGYINLWNELVRSWTKILYENANKDIQLYIEKFIDPNRVETIGHFEYFNIKIKDPRYRNLGEYFKRFEKNIDNFPELMSEIWKNRESCFMDPERIYKEWMEKKITILNSKILEHIITDSITKNNPNDIEKIDFKYKRAGGNIKMKLMKTLVEKIGCLERSVYYLGNNGNSFHIVPSRKFFRENYENIDIRFDYHVKMLYDPKTEENNDFKMKIHLYLDNEHFIDCVISVKFSGKEMSPKLSAKYQFENLENFNKIVYNKINKNEENDQD